MRYFKQICLVTLSIFLFLSLYLVDRNYQANSLENNSLYINPQASKKEFSTVDSKTSLLKTSNFFIEMSTKEKFLTSSNYKYLDFPIYEGRTFSSRDDLGALIGSKVKKEKIKGVEYIRLNNKNYRVLGYLGQHKDSNLDSTTVINDPAVFKESGTIIIDNHYKSLILNTIFLDNNFGNRDKSAIFFRVMSIFSLVLLMASSILLVIYFKASFKVKNDILSVMGYSKKSILISNLSMIIRVISLPTKPILLATFLLNSSQIFLANLIFYVCFLVMTMVVFLLDKQKLRRIPR